VALVSSGDSGIYAMAGLALELWLSQRPGQRPSFEVHPGISALQLAAAKAGAPLMHDFCTISLSDRLTPWDVIEKRLQAAAAGDFVVALYNPRSKGRGWQLARAQELLLAGRPATRKRWPDGVDQPSFFEKALPRAAPDWLTRGTQIHRSGVVVYPIIDSTTALAWIAQQAALEIHVPQWRFGPDGKPGPANRLVFDLDPGEGVTMAHLGEVAHAVRELVDDIGLKLYPLTSGSKGLHLYASLADPVSSSSAALLAHRVAQQLEGAMPTLVTATMTKSRRAGKVFLDWSQNNAAKTTIAPYSLRGRESPTVAAPRTWDEISDPELAQLRYDQVLARVAEQGDLLAGLDGDVSP
jgi:bifunctional non-homologous end joining protein LigD